MAFAKAVKSKARLRLAIFGPSGAGKTFTALRVASGMVKPEEIALIDTEHESASKYSDRFGFDTDALTDPSIENLIRKLEEAAEGGYKVVIIDSLSHPWQELLDEMDKVAKTKCSGNSFAAWREGTPKQRKLVKALLDYPGHLIATMRSKTEWTIEKDERTGKTKPVRTGLSPEQGKGIEYEFDMLIELSPEHIANVIKDRTGKYQDELIEKPGEKFGKELIAWLSEGVEKSVASQTGTPPATTTQTPPPAAAKGKVPTRGQIFNECIAKQGLTQDEAIRTVYTVVDAFVYPTIGNAINLVDEETYKKIIDALKAAGEKKRIDRAIDAEAQEAAASAVPADIF